MRFLTGDDTGILKWVRVEAKKVERCGGSRRRGDAAERLCWAGPPAQQESRVAVAYASGVVEARATASGDVQGTYRASAEVRCLQALDTGLLVAAKDGKAGIVVNWCAEEFPQLPGANGDDGDAEEAEGDEGEQRGPEVRRFELPGPVAEARLDPTGSQRLAFGGDENDLKIYDLAKEQITWRARNLRENALCLRIPTRISTVQWATQLAPARSLLLCGTTDGKVRLYDAGSQRKPLYELLLHHKQGAGSGGWTGAADDVPRPVVCSSVAVSYNNRWSLFVGNTMGSLREYDLRKLPTCKAPEVVPGRKRHLDLASRFLPMRRGYRGIMGSIRGVDVHCSGTCLAAVGLGRFAYVFETRRRKMVSKVFLKQKLCSVLMSDEPYTGVSVADAKGDGDESDITGDEKDEDSDEGGEEEEAAAEDEVQEGFSSDEDGGGGEGGEGGDGDDGDGDDGDGSDGDAAAEPAKRRRVPKRRRRGGSAGGADAEAAGDGDADGAGDAAAAGGAADRGAKRRTARAPARKRGRGAAAS